MGKPFGLVSHCFLATDTIARDVYQRL
jgi:hypothetical protein